jgi:hypothetical protein
VTIQLYHSARYFADLGAHAMPIRKFGLVREAIEREGLPVRIDAPDPVTDEDLLRVPLVVDLGLGLGVRG